MSSHHRDVEYIPLDSGPGEPNVTRRPFASAKYLGHLFLAAVLFAGALIGGGIGRWATTPNIITTIVPSTADHEPVHFEPILTIFDSFLDLCV